MTRQDILQILKESKEEIKNKYKAELKGIFGSYARGQQKSGSDVDVLVSWDNNADLFDLVGLGLFLEEKLALKVDIVPERYLRRELTEKILNDLIAV